MRRLILCCMLIRTISMMKVYTLYLRLFTMRKGTYLKRRKEIQTALIFKPADPYLIKFLSKVNYKLSYYQEAINNNMKLNVLYSIPRDLMDSAKLAEYKEKSKKYNKNFFSSICYILSQ